MVVVTVSNLLKRPYCCLLHFLFIAWVAGEKYIEMRLESIREQRGLVWGVALFCFVVLMLVTPRIPQSQAYHNFADRRNFFGVPNTLNVISNFPFLIVGIVGLVLCLHGNYLGLSLQGETWGWACFYIAVAATAFGSSYYHLKPDDARLVWDRLPMTIAFSSIMAVFIIERIDERMGSASLLPFLLAGAVSVAYWRFADDLRPYIIVQFIPCIAIPSMTIALPPKYTHSVYWLWAAGWYLLAKVEESMDKKIYKWAYYTISGHTLKHLCAAMVPVFITVMLARRSIKIERNSICTNFVVCTILEQHIPKPILSRLSSTCFGSDFSISEEQC